MNTATDQAPPLRSSNEKRHRLARILRENDTQTQANHPLSYGQRALWYVHQTAPESPAYHMAFATRIHSAVDTQSLRRACQDLIGRHAVLRTTYCLQHGEPVQVVHGHQTVCFEQIDTSNQSDRQIDERITQTYRHPFDLETGPVFRVHLFSQKPNEHVLLVTIHHIAYDGWSLWTVQDELRQLYGAHARGDQPTLPPIDMSYTDFADWQRQMLEGEQGTQMANYWKKQLAGANTVLDLPTYRPRPPVQRHLGDSYAFKLSRPLSGRLKSLAQAEGVTPYMLLLAAYQLLLHRYTGQEDILIGSPTSGRTRDEFALVAGYFVNPVVMRASFRGIPTFHAFLMQTRQTVLSALSCQDYPFPLLVEQLAPRRDPSYSPLFQTTFSLQKAQTTGGVSGQWTPGDTQRRVQWAGLDLTLYEIPQGQGQFDIELEMLEADNRFFGTFKYNIDLFDRESFVRVSQHFVSLLESIADDPEQLVSELSLMDDHEKHQVVVQWNRTQKTYPLDRPLHRLCQDQAQRTPHAVAVEFDAQQLTYTQLHERANQLAHHLQGLGVGPDVLVAICMDRSIEMVVALLAVLKAGGAYVPIDPTYPPKRLQSMLDDAATPVLLTQRHLKGLLSNPPANTVVIDDPSPQIAGHPTDAPPCEATADHLAYMIYTSGSTGQPKGVMNTHRGICNRLLWMQDEYQLAGDDRVLQKTPFSFDVSVWEFFWPLITGATLVVAKPGGHKDSAYLVDLITRRDVTTIHFVPPMLQAFLEDPHVKRCTSLRRVICSGEALPFELKERFFQNFDTQLHNLYGPTEAAVDVTACPCQPGGDRPMVPIGRPVANTQIYILDKYMQPVPIGVPGELHIGGVQVARGYRNQRELAAQKFVRNPFGTQPSDRLYKTGDLARYCPEGEIEFLGRLDHQVKIRGFRIELGEIEAVLARNPSVREAVVVVREDRPGDRRLVGYVVANQDHTPDPTELRVWLGQHLPDHAVPTSIVAIDAFALTPNGKIDRRALPQPSPVNENRVDEAAQPKTATQQALAEIWTEVLGLKQIGIHDNFFDLGGHSLMTTRVITQVLERFDRELSLADFVTNPTIAGVAGVLDAPPDAAPRRAGLDLKSQAVLDDSIQPSQTRRVATGEPRCVLLTGATGFLGAHLLDELLCQTTADICCLVRCRDNSDGLARIRSVLASYGLKRHAHNDRIVPLAGDLAQPRLGLSELAFARLADQIDVIYHNGALVNFIYPYEKLKASNVLGTQEVLRLASGTKIKPVHFVSTLSVFSWPDYGTTTVTESDPIQRISGLHGGYPQSKWVAEKLVTEAQKRGLPVCCYRPGRVTGHTQTGICNTDDLIFRLIKGCVQLAQAPDTNIRIDMTPVDHVASSIVHLSRQTQSLGKAFHLLNPQPLAWNEMVEMVRSFGHPVRLVKPQAWRAALVRQTNDSSTNALSPLLPLFCGPEASFEELAGPAFDQQQTRDALATSTIRCPAIDATLLNAYLSFFDRCGFLNLPQDESARRTGDTNHA